MTVSGIISYQLTTRYTEKEEIAKNRNLLFYGASHLSQYMESINQISLSFYNDVILGGTLFKIINEGLSDYQSKMTISQTLLRISNFLPDIYQVRLDIFKSGKSYQLVNKNLIMESTVAGPAVVSDSLYGQVEPTHNSRLSGTRTTSMYTSKPVVSFHRPIYEIPGQEIMGHLTIDFTLDSIARIAKQLHVPGEELYILDTSGHVVYASDETLTGTVWQAPWLGRILDDFRPSGEFVWSDQRFDGIYTYTRLGNHFMDWIIVKGVPYSMLYNNARNVAMVNAAINAAFLAVVLAATVWISIRFTKPILQLARTMAKVEQGHVNIKLTTKRNDEIGILIRRFQQMMSTINNLVLREMRLQLANRTNQLKALQAQMNPHFLNNALQSIGTLALQRQELKIYSLVSSLGQMMNYHMNTDEIIVALADEIRYVQSYLELQKQRFENVLIVHEHYDESALNIPVPKMILQPLVENVFKHGFSAREGAGELWITCRKPEEGPLLVMVEDNGKGMSERERLALQERFNNLENKWVHEISNQEVGLVNVLTRLRLYYGPEASIRIERSRQGGLSVSLRIPVSQGGLPREAVDRG
jgi:two-component system sensor histidine kinase YesM